MLYLSCSKYVVLIMIMSELLILSVVIFSQGFLLTRDVMKHKSKCEDFDRNVYESLKSNYRHGCWIRKRFNRTVLLIIDALRYDFATYNISRKKDAKLYENNLRCFSDLLLSHPENGLLVPFMADPPTTTMQRLKGLTTGSLPTFIDAGHNFASSEITEDNLIDQMKDSGKRIVVLGDDTWGELFPNRFYRSHLYPSFNVMDLDTVDNGILEHIYDEMKTEDWDVMIAHFLGVDHCGHRYGPNHSEMRRKLQQMNDVIRNVSSLLNRDTLLVVMGDHGMTATGDHGGDSQLELEAALFMYSPGLGIVPSASRYSAVSQIDIVPTLSFLLGIPVPYSSLGKIIEPVFSENLDKSLYKNSRVTVNDILYLNLQQVRRYLESYQAINNEFPKTSWLTLQELYKTLNSSSQFGSHSTLAVQYLLLARMMCKDIWATFNVPNMVVGLLCLVGSILMIVNIVLTNNLAFYLQSVIKFRHILYLFLSVNMSYGISFFFFSNTLNFLCLLLFFALLLFLEVSARFPESFATVSFLTVITCSLCSFSNSFVIMEDSVSSFLCLSLVGYTVSKYFYIKFNNFIKSKSAKQNLGLAKSDAVLLCCLVCFFISIRLSHIFWKCREEQHWCDAASLVHVSLSGLPREFHNFRYFTSLVPLVSLIALPQHWLQSCGNLNGWESGIFVTRTVPLICGLLTGGYWALKSAPSLAKSMSKVAVIFPQLIYLITCLGAMFIIYNPIFVYKLPPLKESLGSTDASVIPQLFKKLKQKYDEGSVKIRRAPVVYGLATAVSAPFIVLLLLTCLVLVIISGDGMTPGVCLLVLTAVLCLILHSILMWKNAASVDYLLMPNWNFVTVWFLLSINGFYSTGHQATFSTLDWAAAFVGYDGVGSYLIPAVLMILNTFSSHLLFGTSLPLLIIVPLSFGFLWPSLRPSKLDSEDISRGEFLLIERPAQAKESLFAVATVYVMFHAVKILFTSVAAFFLRRHLMVWKIFAPHFIFEAVGLIITCVGVSIGIAAVFRIMASVEKWSENL